MQKICQNFRVLNNALFGQQQSIFVKATLKHEARNEYAKTGQAHCTTLGFVLKQYLKILLALFRNQTQSLIKHEKITTTLEKAKELRKFADKMVTLAKKGTQHAQRQIAAFVYEDEMVKKAMQTFPQRFAQRQG